MKVGVTTMNCPWCQTKVEVVMTGEGIMQLDSEMVKQDEVSSEAVQYALHKDGTATNLRVEGKIPERFRIEHRWLCPAVVTVSAIYQLATRLRKVVEARAKA